MAPLAVRTEAWSRLATDLPLDLLDTLTDTHPLSDAPELAPQILAGHTRGRVVFTVS
jgi:acrylyl-CoA reductase (NADPH)